MCGITKLFARFEHFLLHVFYMYGHFLGKHPVWFIVIPVLAFGGLAVGFLDVESESDTETLYAPYFSRAIDDRKVMEANFPDMSGYNFHPYSPLFDIPEVIAIFSSKTPQAILDSAELAEIRDFRTRVKALSVVDGDKRYSYADLCAYAANECVTFGDFVLDQGFQHVFTLGGVTYPYWTPQEEAIDMRRVVANVKVTPDGVLESANELMINFPLRRDTKEIQKLSYMFEKEYLRFMENANFTTVEAVYSASQSLELELDKTTGGDVKFFIMSFMMMITYATIATTGGDIVSTRALLASGGVLAVALGVLGAFGLVAMTGVKYVSMVSVMPFLTLGIGVNDMFLLMSAWSETLVLSELTIPERIGIVFKKAGIGITITSLTDFLAFLMGYFSLFVSVQNFCVYSGAGVILCYLANVTIFGACLALHGRRVYARRHTLTFRPVPKSRDEILADGGGSCNACMCGGEIPSSAQDEQSVCERGPHKTLTRILLMTPVRVLILLVFFAYLGVALWGCTKLKQGLNVKDLVLEKSYLLKYQIRDEDDFGLRIPISFVSVGSLNYSTPTALQNMRDLLDNAKNVSLMDPKVETCWLTLLSETPYYNISSDKSFMSGLQEFLQVYPNFYNDVKFDNSNSTIVASRCHVSSGKLVDSNEQADAMVKMREVADAATADVFAFSRAFVIFEQFITILPSTLLTVGQTLAVMLVVTIIFLPNLTVVALVMMQVISILIGVFGFMAHCDLNLSAITMIHLIMSVGFSVDFCAHVCTAYMVSEASNRKERAMYAVVHASGPILNGGFSSMLGVLVLYFTQSFIFRSFFTIMLLVICFGAAHAIFLIPVLLSMMGPDDHIQPDNDGLHIPPASSNSSHSIDPSSQQGDNITWRQQNSTKVVPVESSNVLKVDGISAVPSASGVSPQTSHPPTRPQSRPPSPPKQS